jgi:hypothetical protein
VAEIEQETSPQQISKCRLIPEPPTDIVGNGDNVWAWAAAFSRAVHLRDQIATLSRQVAKRECGDCGLWMTKGCPRERSGGLSGYSKGPSCADIPCASYAETASCAALRAKRRTEMEALRVAL